MVQLIVCCYFMTGLMDVILLPEAMVVTTRMVAGLVCVVMVIVGGVSYMMGYQRGHTDALLIKSFHGTIFEILTSDVYHTNSNCAGLRKIHKSTTVRKRRPCRFCLGMPGDE